MIRATGLDEPNRVEFTNGRQTAVADVPPEKGGRGEGLGPHELLEAALATCQVMTARKAAAEHGFPLSGVRSAVRIDRPAPGAATLWYELEFDGPLTPDQIERLRAAARDCPVARTLTGSLTIRPEA